MITRIYQLARKRLRMLIQRTRGYELARKKFLDGSEWGVDYSTGSKSHPFYIWQQHGPESYGSGCSVQELLSDRWRNHLRLCGALWLVPVLERFAAGEAITPEAVLHAYEQRHGQPPPSPLLRVGANCGGAAQQCHAPDAPEACLSWKLNAGAGDDERWAVA